ncbi:MAG: NAD(P)-dependent oxidoreductase [Candidatus Pacebacteria bacterium]|jgi:D-3-phosphoglycerate dehydrogenase|nr:hypothetical protein [bacterium]MDP6527897.1 NAD(P)-dependent oxidoreductase [Candidatus Paceibacterota bacterium]MDP6659707.1 NAD(P)-dependent oxidoreductase [Candidatus Paceibacterota bacterium]|tara:strand:- start:19867 stop:20823 length:957 start_codon:yes stop_codon:yes gene_type:complete
MEDKDIVVYTGPEDSFRFAEKVLGEKFSVVRVEPTEDSLFPKFVKCVAFLDASMKVRIPADLINKAQSLKLVVTATTGADHIDKDALGKRQIPLLTLKGETEILNSFSGAAELSWLFLMACARKFRGALDHVQDGKWERTEFPGIMLANKTLGIIGIGRLGSWMARYGHAFKMNVQAHDPFAETFPAEVKKIDLDTLLKTSDFISVHVHLSDDTRNLLSADKIAKIKKGASLINTSRGEIVDEEALVEALERGDIAAVGVDVLAGEPEIDKNVLWQYSKTHEKVLITPHIGGFCPESVDRVVEFSAERILKYFNEGQS